MKASYPNPKRTQTVPALEADGVIFNFGWDPAGDHQTVTQPQDSLRAVQAALERLRVKGRMSLVFYPHAGGRRCDT